MLTFPAHAAVFSQDDPASVVCRLTVEAEGVAALIRWVGVGVHGHPGYGILRVYGRFEFARRPDVPDAASNLIRTTLTPMLRGLSIERKT